MVDSNVLDFLSSMISEAIRLLKGVPIPGTSFTAWSFVVGAFCFAGITIFIKLVFVEEVDDGGSSYGSTENYSRTYRKKRGRHK